MNVSLLIQPHWLNISLQLFTMHNGEVKQKYFLFSDVKKLTDLFSLAINSLYNILTYSSISKPSRPSEYSSPTKSTSSRSPMGAMFTVGWVHLCIPLLTLGQYWLLCSLFPLELTNINVYSIINTLSQFFIELPIYKKNPAFFAGLCFYLFVNHISVHLIK